MAKVLQLHDRLAGKVESNGRRIDRCFLGKGENEREKKKVNNTAARLFSGPLHFRPTGCIWPLLNRENVLLKNGATDRPFISHHTRVVIQAHDGLLNDNPLPASKELNELCTAYSIAMRMKTCEVRSNMLSGHQNE